MDLTTTIAVIADIHFGANFTQTHTLSSALKKYVIHYLKKSPPGIIVLAGDIFDKKLSVNSPEAVLCNDFIVSLLHAFPTTYILIIKGTRSHDLNQLDLFKPFISEYFRIYETVTVEYIMGMKLLMIPEEYYPDKTVYDTYIKNVEPYDFVFFHGLFNHAGSYTRTVNLNKICFTFEDFKGIVYGKAAGGHIHKHLVYKNIEYVNSFDCWSHGEEDDKGYMLYTYNITKHKIIHEEYILNKDAHKYITIPYSAIEHKSVDELVEYLDERAKKVKSLRIRISKDDIINENMLHALFTISFSIPNLIIEKKVKTEIIKPSIEKQKEIEERKKILEQYVNLSFDDITIKFAKTMLNVDITLNDIKQALS
jgi:hypothetical protein